jgi:hypothetical protein
MSNYYDIGDIIRCSSTFTDTGAVKQDPTTVKFVYTTPAGVDTVFSRTGATTGTVDSVTRASSGTFYSDVAATASGAYWYRFSSTGNITAMDEATFRVRHRYTST